MPGFDHAELGLATRAVKGGIEHRLGQGVTPSIELSSTFVHHGDPQPGSYSYARANSPSYAPLESTLASLEGGVDAIVFSAGVAAANALLEEATPGTAIVLPDDAYFGIRVHALEVYPKQGIEVRVIDQGDLGALDQALDGASFLWTETPTNPHLAVRDLAAIGKIAAAHNVPWACDNTFATPILQQPLKYGAVASMHSVTKYIGGHSDLLLGAAIVSDQALAARVRVRRNHAGTQPDGFSVWLARRGTQTLPLRIRHQSTTAQALAERLATHPKVKTIYYPGLPEHPGHEIAAAQMDGYFGAIISIVIEGGREAAEAAIEKCRVWVPATSLGGVESLIERRARWTGEVADAALIRLSVGLEDLEDLWNDLDWALTNRK
jgi:cystathionine gamma-synthase